MTSPSPRNVIYSTIPHRNWVCAADILRNQYGLNPVYWESSGDLKEHIEAKFPDAVVHNSIDATKGISPENLNINSPFNFPLDRDLIEGMANEQLYTLKMMDRIDPGPILSKHTLGYNERVRHFYRLTSYWLNVIDSYNPELIIFGGVPHLINDYILYAVAKQQDIETILFTETSLPRIYYTRDGLFEGFEPLADVDIRDQTLPEEVESYLDTLKSDYSEGMPSYMHGTTTDFSFSSVLESLRKHFIPSSANRIKELLLSKRVLRWKMPVDMHHGSGKVEESEFPWLDWLYYLLKSRYYLRKLREEYRHLATPPSFDEEYLYYPIHYQPERTTSPEGGHYAHQELVVQLLASCAEGMKVYVKEHPSQFDPELYGQLGRKLYFYEDILSNENVRLLPLDANPYELIDNATAVATVTGTAGWEAINRGTAAIVFGAAWYLKAPNVYKIDTQADLRESLRILREGEHPDEMTIRQFVKSLVAVGYQGNLNTPTTPSNEQAETIAQAVIDQIDT